MAILEMQKKKSKGAGSSTQSFLAISDIRDDCIVTTDGGTRAVIAVSSTNFVLKSQQEQEAILSRYQSFLNSLEFSVQILMQSRRLDIHGYLARIEERVLQQTNELLRMQTEEYAEYIKKLMELGNIMNKTFYVIVPFSTGGPVEKGMLDKLKDLINPTGTIVSSQKKFVEERQQLADRVARVMEELSSLSLRTVRLNTQELVELLYNSYNLGSEQAGMVEFGQIQMEK